MKASAGCTEWRSLRRVGSCLARFQMLGALHCCHVVLLCLFLATPLVNANGDLIFQRFSIAEGLSQVSILSLAEGRDGMLWIGTEEGLNRFDGIRFESFHHVAGDSSSLASSFIHSVTALPDGNVLVINGAGIDLFHPDSRTVSHIQTRNNLAPGALVGLPVARAKDEHGNVWLGDEAGLTVYHYGKRTLQRIEVWGGGGRPPWHNSVTGIAAPQNNQIWVVSLGGLRIYDQSTQQFLPNVPAWLNSIQFIPRVVALHAGQGGEVLLADSKNLYTVHPGQQQVLVESLADLAIDDVPISLLSDRDGGVWATTGRGLFYRPFGAKQAQRFAKLSDYADSLQSNLVTRIIQDRVGNIWLGSYTAGLAKISANGLNVRYFRSATFAQGNVSAEISRLARLSNDKAVMVTADGWVSTLDLQTKRVEPFSPYLGVNSDRNAYPFVNSLAVDHRANVWLASSNGVFRLRANERPQEFRPKIDPSQVRSDVWSDAFVDEKARLWLLNPFSGLSVINTEFEPISIEPVSIANLGVFNNGASLYRLVRANDGGFWISTNSAAIYYWHEPNVAAKLYPLSCASVERVFDIKEQADGALLLASNIGLLRFLPSSGHCSNLNTDARAPSMTTNAIQMDPLGNAWVSTNRGIARYDLAKNTFSLFGFNDGLHRGEFNGASSLQVNDQMLFGSIRGTAVFDPLLMKLLAGSPEVIVSEVKVNFSPYPIAVFRADPEQSNILELQRDHNNAAFHFAATDLTASSEYLFSYKMLGASTERWIEADSGSRVATFTELTPGNYQFLIKARRPYSAWGPETVVPVRIIPAWWETPWAWLVYLLALALTVILVWRWRTILLRRRNDYLSRAVEQRTNEVELLLKQRTRLFVNVSHELRTPLTLIAGPLSDVMAEALAPSMRKKLQLVLDSSNRLTELVDQVLALARLQDKSSPQPQKNIIALKPHLLAMLESYEVIAQRSGIAMSWGKIEDIDVHGVSDLAEIVFGNIVSNAIKYTNAGGTIRVSLRYSNNGELALFECEDSGIGMALDEIEHIFEPFYRAQHEERMNPLLSHSSGLGLPHVKEVLAIHDGNIHVESTVGAGSVFRVEIPAVSREWLDNTASHEGDRHGTEIAANDEGWERPSLLIIEDNRGLNDYLKQIFASDYLCLTSGNGAEAEDLAYEHLPDLILSDIRLPGLDGVSLAERLKADVRTSHIPIVLLTAMPDYELKMSGLKMQVDDYISKPFDVQELKLRVSNLIRNRRRCAPTPLVAAGDGSNAAPAAGLPLSELDQRFMGQLDHIVAANIGNPDFELHDLSKNVYLSKKQVQRKVKALTGLSPMEYLRHYRISRACEMLLAGRSIADVCYSVGFSSQSYFTTCFKLVVGQTPKLWQQNSSRKAKGENA